RGGRARAVRVVPALDASAGGPHAEALRTRPGARGVRAAQARAHRTRICEERIAGAGTTRRAFAGRRPDARRDTVAVAAELVVVASGGAVRITGAALPFLPAAPDAYGLSPRLQGAAQVGDERHRGGRIAGHAGVVHAERRVRVRGAVGV